MESLLEKRLRLQAQVTNAETAATALLTHHPGLAAVLTAQRGSGAATVRFGCAADAEDLELVRRTTQLINNSYRAGYADVLLGAGSDFVRITRYQQQQQQQQPQQAHTIELIRADRFDPPQTHCGHTH